ncbi:hypothetical protein ACFL0T_00040 [Candidatus Omnitrophota bacterium]
MSHKKFGISFLVAFSVLLGALIFSIYIKHERFLDYFKDAFEKKVFDRTGIELNIGSIRGNPFKRVELRELSCRYKDFVFKIKKARLEYTLLDLIFKKKGAKKDLNLSLQISNGSLDFKENLIISKQVSGRVEVAQDKIVLKDLRIKVFDLLDNRVEGEITLSQGIPRLDLLFSVEPIFEKDKRFLSTARISAKGPVRNLSIYGNIKNEEGLDISVRGYHLISEGILNIGSKFNFKNTVTGKPEPVMIDIEFPTDKLTFDALIIPPDGKIDIRGDFSKWPLVLVEVVNSHVKIGGLDFSNIINLSSRVIFKDGDFLHTTLDISTESSVLNYYPIDECEAYFWIDRDLLKLIFMRAGDTITASGAIALKPPRDAFLKVFFTDFDVSYPSVVFTDHKTPGITGALSGEILIEGPIDKLVTKSKLYVAEGRLDKINYENIIINIKGEGPIASLHDSRIIRSDSFLMLDGDLDFRNISNGRFLEDIKISTDNKTVIWEGWDISRAKGDQELTLSKGEGGGFSLGFKRHLDDETVYSPIDTAQDEFKLEYKLSDDDSVIQIKTKEKEDFVGVVKKYKF